MKAIKTEYLPWTETKPTRIIARAPGVSPVVLSIHSIPDDIDEEGERHGYVASQLAFKMGWYTPTNYLIGGCLEFGQWAFVFSDSYVIAGKDRHEEEV